MSVYGFRLRLLSYKHYREQQRMHKEQLDRHIPLKVFKYYAGLNVVIIMLCLYIEVHS